MVHNKNGTCLRSLLLLYPSPFKIKKNTDFEEQYCAGLGREFAYFEPEWHECGWKLTKIWMSDIIYVSAVNVLVCVYENVHKYVNVYCVRMCVYVLMNKYTYIYINVNIQT